MNLPGALISGMTSTPALVSCGGWQFFKIVPNQLQPVPSCTVASIVHRKRLSLVDEQSPHGRPFDCAESGGEVMPARRTRPARADLTRRW